MNKLNNTKTENKDINTSSNNLGSIWAEEHAVIIASAVIILISYIIFSYAGAKTMGFWIMFYIIPPYFIFRHFELDKLESFVFSVFAGAGVLPTIVFFLNFVIPSLRWSTVIVFIAEALTAVYLHAKKK